MFTTDNPHHHHLYSNTNNNLVMDCPQIMIKPMATKWNNYTNKIEVAPNCPRCASSNTKFCYYNNYSLSQPRYFCKACRRYWTKGGSLRNVPVGGGCRKTRRSRSSRPTYASGGGAPTPPPPSESESDGGACIDLAAVFANYVNRSGGEESFSPGGSSGSSSENVPASSLEMDSQMDFVGGDQVQELPQFSLHQEMDGQDFVYQQAFDGISLGDELLWSEGSDLPSFGSDQHPTAQDQDFGLFSPDDQFRISGTENWASFDLSTIHINCVAAKKMECLTNIALWEEASKDHTMHKMFFPPCYIRVGDEINCIAGFSQVATTKHECN